MGYTTDFENHFTFAEPIRKEHADYLRAFNGTRRMKRNAEILKTFDDPIRIAAGLPIGDDGAYFVGGDGYRGQGRDASVIDYNQPPGQIVYSSQNWNEFWETNKKLVSEGKAQPGLWCQWTVSEDNTRLEWDGGEKFYHYVEWLQYILNNFIIPWGYSLSGEVSYQGEEDEDKGVITVKDNQIIS